MGDETKSHNSYFFVVYIHKHILEGQDFFNILVIDANDNASTYGEVTVLQPHDSSLHQPLFLLIFVCHLSFCF